MKVLKLFTFIGSISFAYSIYANVPLNNDLLDENPSNLKSIPLLESLKGLHSKLDYQAPFVQELNTSPKVRTLFVESNDLPMVDIQLTFNAGSARDEEIVKGTYGLASMTAQLMKEGTDQYNAAQIAAAFEAVGAQFSVQAHRDMFVVRLRVLSDPKKLEPALTMMLEVLNNAAFKNQSLNLVLSNTQVGQKQLKSNPSRLLSIQFNRSLYGKHPYAEPTSGTNAGLQSLNPTLLKQFRDQFIVAQNMNIAITGNMTPKDATKLANTISKNLRQGSKAQPLPMPILTTGFNIKHIPFDSSQAYVSMGHITIKRDDPDRLALEVANRILGGSGFNSILMKELRVKRGYTYGASSSFSFNQVPGTFSLGYSTRQDQLMDSIHVAHKVLVNFSQQPIDKKVVEETKTGLLRAFPMNYSSNATINSQLGVLGFYDEPADYLNKYSEKLSQLTATDVQNAVRKHIHPDQFTVVIASQDLNQTDLLHILNSNILPNSKIKLPTIDTVPTINTPPTKLEEAVLPDLTQPEALSLI